MLGDSRISEEHSRDPIAYLRLHIHPDEETTELAGDVLTWAERAAAERFGSGFQIEASAKRGSDRRIALLERRGYTIDRVFHMMKRPITEAASKPLPLAGYRLRQFKGESEIDAWLDLYVNAFQDHYDFHPIVREDRVQSLSADDYLPEFDLVIETGNGALAAFSIVDKRVDSTGVVDWHIDLIGTHRDHRKRGLAEWLLRHTIAQVRDYGGAEVSLKVDAASPTGANRLYERLGFVVTSESIDYRKTFA